MHGWVECVPNFSEGQNERLIAELEAIVRAVPGVVFLRSDPNPDHNRTLFTFAGPGRSVSRAAFNLIRGAVERIDLTHHIGVHPRMGAVDVVPFVPLGTTTMEAASELARDLGEEVASKLGVPVFLYEESATRAERRSLAELRKGGFEGHLASGFPVGPPDFGPPHPHPTAGSVAIGARFFIIALNVFLDTNDLEIARTVARAVRESSRGLAAVRALGLPLASQGLVQVSINILDYRITSLTQVMERVREEAGRLGTAILQSELVGLVPRAALVDSVWEMLRLPPQRRERVIEDAVEKSGAFTFAERLAAATPTPGSGAAAARAGLHATSLLRMVAGLALERFKTRPAVFSPPPPEAVRSPVLSSAAGEGTPFPAGIFTSYAPVAAPVFPPPPPPEGVVFSLPPSEGAAADLETIREEAAALGRKLRALEVEDEEAYDRFVATRRGKPSSVPPAVDGPGSPRSPQGDGAAAAAARKASEVPLTLLEALLEILDLCERTMDTSVKNGIPLAAGSDLGGAVELVRTASRISSLNIQSNLTHLAQLEHGGAAAAEIGKRRETLEAEIESRCDRLWGEVLRKFAG